MVEVTIINTTPLILGCVMIISLAVFAFLSSTAKNPWLKSALYFLTMWLVWAAVNVGQVFVDSGESAAMTEWVLAVSYAIYGWAALFFIFQIINLMGIDKDKKESDNIDG